ncbi:SPOR domain-containing protein [bacterium]|nr:SPOR domain-containing protein [bacterium]
MSLWRIGSIIVPLLLFIGCASTRQSTSENPQDSVYVFPDTAIVEKDPVPDLDQLTLPGEALPESSLEMAYNLDDQAPRAKQPHPLKYKPSDGPLDAGDDPVKLAQGWRIEIARASSEAKARAIAEQADSRTSENIHITWEGKYYYVRLGDYVDFDDADKVLRRLRKASYPTARVVSTKVKATDTKSPMNSPHKLKQVAGFRIQLMSLSSESSAEAEAKRASGLLNMPVYVEMANGAFKVRAGDFINHDDAKSKLSSVHGAGFEGAWVVETSVNIR